MLTGVEAVALIAPSAAGIETVLSYRLKDVLSMVSAARVRPMAHDPSSRPT